MMKRLFTYLSRMSLPFPKRRKELVSELNEQPDTSDEKYVISFWFEWGFAYLWPVNEKAKQKFGRGRRVPIENKLPLSPETRAKADELYSWFHTYLDWDFISVSHCIWKQEECDRFKIAVRQFYEELKIELGDAFEIIYEQDEPTEDPDFELYEPDPDLFWKVKLEKQNAKTKTRGISPLSKKSGL